MKVCFIGSGSIGTRHIKNLCQLHKKRGLPLQIDLLRETDRPLAEEVESFINRTLYQYEELASDYDAIFITNPTFMHYETLKKVLPYSSCFFIEKPVFEDVQKSITPFLDNDKKFYVACPLRYTNVMQKAIKVAQTEKIISARAISSSYLPHWRKGIDYSKTYSAHKQQGGGVRIDLIHEWDYLIYLFGYPQKIFSLSGKYSSLRIDSEDIAIYIAEYEDKLVELHLDYFGQKTQRSLELFTLENNYVFDIYNSSIYCNGNLIEQFKDSTNDMYIRELEYFLNTIENGGTFQNNIQTAMNVMKIATS